MRSQIEIDGFGETYILIDTVLGDTTKFFSYSNRVIKKSKNNVILVDERRALKGVNEPNCANMKNGFHQEWFRNGNLKNYGSFNCDKKEGVWHYYSESGNLNRIESYSIPYKELEEGVYEWHELAKTSLKDGSYIDYYSNGQIKEDGMYAIFEQLQYLDTISYFDPTTYEILTKIREGEFWKARSKKIGLWTKYDSSGNLISSIDHTQKSFTDPLIRKLKIRYLEYYERLELLSKN